MAPVKLSVKCKSEEVLLRLTWNTAESSKSLGGSVGEGSSAAKARACAGTVLHGASSADHRSGTGCWWCGRRGSSSRRGSSCWWWWGRSSAGGSRLTSDDDSSSSGTLLSDGHLLEHGLGLVGSWVDREGHSLSAVVGLSAVEPKRRANSDLHSHLGGRSDGVVGVGHETGVHSAGKLVARFVES